MSADKLCRERLRVEKDLIGDSHPFIATDLIVYCGQEEWFIQLARETPITAYTRVYQWGQR